MFGIGVPELILILVVGLVVFGPGKLPEVARSLGRAFGNSGRRRMRCHRRSTRRSRDPCVRSSRRRLRSLPLLRCRNMQQPISRQRKKRQLRRQRRLPLRLRRIRRRRRIPCDSRSPRSRRMACPAQRRKKAERKPSRSGMAFFMPSIRISYTGSGKFR